MQTDLAEYKAAAAIPSIAVALDIMGWLSLVGAVLLAVFAVMMSENPPWTLAAGAIAAGLVLLGFGGIIRALHRIECAIANHKL